MCVRRDGPRLGDKASIWQISTKNPVSIDAKVRRPAICEWPALLTHRLQDMRSKMEDLMSAVERKGLRVNSDKTKIMKVMSTQVGGVRIRQDLIEEVESFQYLGSIISRTGGTDEDIIARISKTRQVFTMLKPVWRSISLSLKSKLRIFTSNVKSVLLYGAETWRTTKDLAW